METTFTYRGITAYFWQESWSEDRTWIYCFDVDLNNYFGTTDIIETIAIAKEWIDKAIDDGFFVNVDEMDDKFAELEF